MFRIAISAALAGFLALIATGPGFAQVGNDPPAQNRIALVIGNSNYQSVTVLPNPANDAKAVSKFLTGAGFEVIKADDLTRDGLRRAVLDFSAKVAEKGANAVALVYYAGHGLQVDGENFLVPVDAKIERESDVPIEALRLADVMNMLAGAPAKTRIVILDACRNNPFSEIKQATGRGLAIVDAPTGSIVSYATAPGMTAADGSGDNSPYTAAFVETAKEPGLLIEQALKKVRLAVHKVTGGEQTPWESSSLTINFSFFPGDTAGGQAGQDRVAAADKDGATGKDTEASRDAEVRKDVVSKDVVSKDVVGKDVAAKNVSFRTGKQTVDDWRIAIRAQPPRDAFDLVISEDSIEGYEAFVAIYPIAPYGPQVRAILDRRQEMFAWYQAVVLNSVAGFEVFLARFPNSDLAATARKLMERSRQRSLANNAAAGFAAANIPRGNLASPQAANAACSCSQPTQRQPLWPQPIRGTPSNATPLPQPPADVFDNPPVVIPPVWGGVPPVWIIPPRYDDYPPGGGHYPPEGGRYPPGDVRYPPGDGHRPPEGGRYPPGDGHRPPEGGKYPPGGDRYPPGGGHRPPDVSKRPPKDASYPPSGDHRRPGIDRPRPRDEARPPRRDVRPPQQSNLPPNIRQRPPRRDIAPSRRSSAPPDLDRRRPDVRRAPQDFRGPPPGARRVGPGDGPPPGARRVGPGFNGPPPGARRAGPGFSGSPQGYRGAPRGAHNQPGGFGGRPSGNVRAPARSGPSCAFINGRRVCR
jgi:uncharacterized caspase-like protein